MARLRGSLAVGGCTFVVLWVCARACRLHASAGDRHNCQQHAACDVQIKAANKTYLRCVAGVAHAEGLMLLAGWRSKVVDMERSLVWEHPQDGHEWRCARAARGAVLSVCLCLSGWAAVWMHRRSLSDSLSDTLCDSNGSSSA